MQIENCDCCKLKKVKLNDTLTFLLINLVLVFGTAKWVWAQTKSSEAEDKELADKLRTDLQFDTNRRNAFFQHLDENKIYDQEREKGLSLFLEEEERWNRLREKESREHAKSRPKPMDDFGPDYEADLKEKQVIEKQREVDRQKHVRTKKNLFMEFEDKIPQTEEKELGLASERPRFDLRRRANNKWVNAGKKIQGSAGSGGGSSSSPFDAPMPAQNDFVAPPIDTNFEDIPPPPPPIPYDNFEQGNAGGFDSGFGDVPPPPPPPPPNDPSWDF